MSRAIAAILIVLSVAALLASRDRRSLAPSDVAAPPSSMPGYGELGACSVSHAVEGDDFMKMNPDGYAELIDGEGNTKTGYWTFDPPTERYTTTFDGKSVMYQHVMLGEQVCLLLKGGRATADMASSWYAIETASDDAD